MQGSKVKAVNTWPTPKSLTELRAFLGAVGYYRRFIKDFSAVASPLFQLLNKDTSWKWTEERQQAFDDLKSRLVQEPILVLPANEGQYILDTDASDFALGAVLSQKRRPLPTRRGFYRLQKRSTKSLARNSSVSYMD